MVQMQIRVQGLNKVVRGMSQLPKSVSKMTDRETTLLMRRIQKSAKLRAPRWSGHLAESITLTIPKRGKLAKQWVLTVGAPYGIFWELGFRPHWVRLDRSTRSGATVADWAADKGLTDINAPISRGSLPVGFSRPTKRPFIRPAFEKNIRTFGQKLDRSLKKAVQEAFR